MIRDQLFGIIDRVYAAAQDRELWPEALAEIQPFFGARGVNLMFNDMGPRPDGVMVNYGIDPELVQLYNDYYVTKDPIVVATITNPPGTFVDSEECFSSSWWRRTELYGDLMETYGLKHIFGSALLHEPNAYGAFSMLRGSEGQSLNDEYREAFFIVARHIRRAIDVHRRLADAERRSDYLAEVVERLACGVILVDEYGSVVHANDTAGRIARLGDGFRFGRLGIAGATGTVTAGLRRLISSALDTTTKSSLEGGGAMRIERPSGLRPFEVLVAPLSSLQRRDGQASAVVFVSDPETTPLPPEVLLGRLFGLTPAETRLAVALVSGDTPETAADRFGVTMATVRSQLRSLFAKTGTKRQSELIGALLRSPAGGLFLQ